MFSIACGVSIAASVPGPYTSVMSPQLGMTFILGESARACETVMATIAVASTNLISNPLQRLGENTSPYKNT
jgi:hypothetical protein